MAIKIMNPGKSIFDASCCAKVYEILADTESDITALGETVEQDGCTYCFAVGSIAYTADLSVSYQLSPSGVWTKTV